MLRSVQRNILCLLLAGATTSAPAFSMLGPFAQDFSGTVWQDPRIGYARGGDIGGPMNLTEEYRWNVRTITYGFDPTFIAYFGSRGVEEVNKAIAILNNLPPVSKMSSSLTEFPLDTRRFNSRASALNLIDLKSTVLGLLMEQLGLADPERWVFSLRGRVVLPANAGTNYSVIMRNFDPVNWAPSKYVNGTLYTYSVIDAFFANPDGSDAVESSVDPLAPVATAVASFVDTGFVPGQFFTGLTRDDVGGLRYLWRKSNLNNENLLADMLGSSSGGAWTPVGQSNALVNTAFRPGVDKVLFKQLKNLAGFGPLRAITNRYNDVFLDPVSGRSRKQTGQRALVDAATSNGVPDILFTAADLGVDAGGLPVVGRRTVVAGVWANNAAINTGSTFGAAGPGVIQPPLGGSIEVSFSNVGPWNFNFFPGFMDEATVALVGFVWGSFDGTTNAPIVYPADRSALELEDAILGGGF